MKSLFVLLFVLLLSISLSAQSNIDVTEYHVVVPNEGAARLEIGAMFFKYGVTIEYADHTTNFEYGLVIEDVTLPSSSPYIEDGLMLTEYVGAKGSVQRYIDADTKELNYICTETEGGKVYSLNDYKLAKSMLKNAERSKAIASVRF